jgi:hypothetical protein
MVGGAIDPFYDADDILWIESDLGDYDFDLESDTRSKAVIWIDQTWRKLSRVLCVFGHVADTECRSYHWFEECDACRCGRCGKIIPFEVR